MIDLWLKVKAVDLAILCSALVLGLAYASFVLLRERIAAWRVRRWNRKADRR